MKPPPDDRPAHHPPKSADHPPGKPDRAAREAAALRANLARRKDQARQRSAAKATPDAER